MDFGFTLKPENTLERTIALTRQAEAAGFTSGWLFDSHVLWRDPYPLLTLMAQATTTMRLGTCVTNPGTREPSVTASLLATLDELSDGRMDLGIGRGDSARRVLGKPPTTMATLEEAITVIRTLVAGKAIEFEGTELQFPWTRGWDLPVWVAGYGPMALAMTGRVADGVILQLADPDLIAWFVGQIREAERAAGRPAGSVRVQAAAPAHVGSLDDCRGRTRWFPALVSNHVVDLVNKYPREQLPESLTGYIRTAGLRLPPPRRGRLVERGFVGDEVTDRFCVLGSRRRPRREAPRLAEAGVDQFNIYLMNGDEEDVLEVYGREIIPAIRTAAGAA
jgi:probable F420-dependent oxidoreductase